MKAIRVHKFGGPEVLQLDDVPDPKPGPGQVVVRIRAAGVNPVDTYIRSGNYAMLPTPPYVPGTDRGRKLVQEHGAQHVLDHSAPDYLKKLMEVTGNRGADVILEMLANVNLQKDIDVVARFGRIVIIGNRGAIEINPRGTMGKDAAIFGLALWNAAPEEMASIHAGLGAGLANGTLRPVVGQELPLKEAARAHEAVLKSGAYGKIVLIP